MRLDTSYAPTRTQNVSYITPAFVYHPFVPSPGIGSIPNFAQTTGVLPGQQPIVPPNPVKPMSNPKQAIQNLPSILNMNVKL